MKRTIVSSGAPWEDIAGYSRAVRIGPHVFVSGTTATDASGVVVHPDDPYQQTLCILEKIRSALEQAGAVLEDVTRTRMYVLNIEHWPEIARAHRGYFGTIRPAATMVEVRRLIAPEMLIEIEVDAVIADREAE